MEFLYLYLMKCALMTKYRRFAELQKAFDAHQEKEKEAHGYEGINFRGKKKTKWKITSCKFCH